MIVQRGFVYVVYYVVYFMSMLLLYMLMFMLLLLEAEVDLGAKGIVVGWGLSGADGIMEVNKGKRAVVMHGTTRMMGLHFVAVIGE